MTADKKGTNEKVHEMVIIRGKILIENPVTRKIHQDQESGINLTGVIPMIGRDKSVMIKDDREITIMTNRLLEV